MRKTIGLIAKKKHRQAVARALAGAREVPGDPRRMAVLLLALSGAAPDSFPAETASMVLNAFCQSSDLPGAIMTIAAFLEAGFMPDDGLRRAFLDAFASPGEGGAPPGAFTEPEYPDPSDMDSSVDSALDFLSTAGLNMLPPAPSRAVPLFRALSEQELEHLLSESRVVMRSGSQFFIHEGDSSDAVYVLAYGRLKVLKGGDSDKYLLGHLLPGSFFGEMALVTSGPRTASVKAESPSVALEIPASVFEKLVVDNPALARELTMYTRFRLLKNLMTISPLFSPIPADKRREVIQAFKARVYEPGDSIVRQGDPSPGLFMVASGEVYIERRAPGREPVRVATLGPGEVFGEMSLIRGGDATADVIAGEDSAVVMFLSREKFNEISSTVPELLSQVFQTVLMRTEMNENVDDQEPEEPLT